MPSRAPLHSERRSASNPLFEKTDGKFSSRGVPAGKAYICYHSTRWNKVRSKKFTLNPICENCLISGKVAQTTSVHHKIKPEENPERAFDLDNLLSLCEDCHRILGKGGRRILIYGPPGAGKTTYALRTMGERDILVDIDRIVEAIGSESPDGHATVDRHYLLGFGIVLRDTLLGYIGDVGHTHNVYVTTTMSSEAAIGYALTIRAEALLINPGVHVCEERIRMRGRDVDRLIGVALCWK